MAKASEQTMTVEELVDYEKKMTKRIHKLQTEQLGLREQLRNCNGALKRAIQDLLNGMSEGHQMKLRFGPIRDDEDEKADPPGEDNLDARAAKNQ